MRSSLSAALLAALLTPSLDAAVRLPEPSPEAVVAQEVGVSKVTITYHRPAVKGRVIWGELVPWGEVWRLGANDATTIELSRDGRINGREVPAGKYALFAIPRPNAWTIIVNKQPKQWGSFFYKADDDLVRFDIKPQEAPHAEWFDIDLAPSSDSAVRADIRWEKVILPLTIEFDTPRLVWSDIDAALAASPKWDDYHNAVRYALLRKERLDEAEAWLTKAMEHESFWNYELKGLYLHARGRTTEAMAMMKKAGELAAGKAPAAYIKGLEQTVAKWRDETKQ